MTIPYNSQSISSGQSSESSGLTLFDCILPPPAVPLLALLLLILPMALLASQSLFVPLIESLMGLFMSGSEGMTTTLPWYFYLKLVAFGILAFFGLFQLYLRIKTSYFSVWAKRFPCPHALHIPYHPDAQQSTLSLINWSLYRLLNLVGPPIGLMALTAGLGVLELYLFNVFSGMPFLSLPIQFIIALFLFMLLSLFTGFALLNSAWTFFATVYGDIIAITEPELPSKTVYERCSRIAFSSPLIYMFYPLYGLFLLGVLVEVYLLLSHYTIQDLITWRLNIPMVLTIEGFTLALYLGLGYMKFLAYHQALTNYYNKLPLEFKDRYTRQSTSQTLYP